MQLRAALRTIPVSHLTLHEDLLHDELTHGQLVWALGGAAATLTALRDLPLAELHDSRPDGLAACSLLQALTLLQQPGDSGSFRATMLPQSLTALRLEAADPWATKAHPPQLIAMGRLHHLQHVTLVGHASCLLRYGREAEERVAAIPHSLEVRSTLHPCMLSECKCACETRRCTCLKSVPDLYHAELHTSTRFWQSWRSGMRHRRLIWPRRWCRCCGLRTTMSRWRVVTSSGRSVARPATRSSSEGCRFRRRVTPLSHSRPARR